MDGIILLSLLGLAGLGDLERCRHRRNLERIRLRIMVNGVRGKSTVTRLITGILKEAGIRVMGKTTGTAARLIYWHTEQEKPFERCPEGPNIREQKAVVAEAARLGAEALVNECMAVNPDYQVIFQEQLLKAHITVIVNVLEDHMDVLGPTLKEVAEAFAATIPRRGYLVITDGPYAPLFRRIAARRGTAVVTADPDAVDAAYLSRFDYTVFPDNAALALAVGQVLGIDRETALKGMLKARPDPGALRITPVGDPRNPAWLVNAFAANDARSTLKIWERVEQDGYPVSEPIVIINCRPDRIDRTEQFVRSVLPRIPAAALVVLGAGTGPVLRAYEQGLLPAGTLLQEGRLSLRGLYQALQPLLPGRVIFGVGNIHGAEELLEMFLANAPRAAV